MISLVHVTVVTLLQLQSPLGSRHDRPVGGESLHTSLLARDVLRRNIASIKKIFF